MKVVILCGGQGSRLREETEYRPKPLVEIGGRPILWHIMKIFAHSGYQDFVMCLGYRGWMIKEFFLNYDEMTADLTIGLGRPNELEYHDRHNEQGYRVTLANTGLETMTGGRVHRVRRYVDGDTFMVTYGDGVGDIDVKKLVEFHHSHGKIATVTGVRPTSKFGVLELDSRGLVEAFTEKPKMDGWSSAGFFVFNRRIFDYLEDDEACILEGEPLATVAAAGEMVAYQHEGSFHTMDTYREYMMLNELWDSGEASWRVWSS